MTTGEEAAGRLLHQMSERLHDILVDLALERDHEAGEIFHRLPAPLDEFGLVAAGGLEDVDLAVIAREGERVPLLRLAAILAFFQACRATSGGRS